MANPSLPDDAVALRRPQGIKPSADAWRVSNCALSRLLAAHRRHLAPAVASARRIRRALAPLIAAMASLNRQTCRFCPEPCCIANTVWFDFRDLLCFHLLEYRLPAQQAATEPGEACPFLGGRGCRLPWHRRPWMCVKYICPTQLAGLNRAGRPDPAALDGRIAAIENQRVQVETDVLVGIKPKNRTTPSSALAWPL